MKTKSTLLVALLVAANVAFAASGQEVNTASPATTNQADLHNVQANYATVQRAHGVVVPVASKVEAVSTPVAALNTASPATTNQADLHNVQADADSVARAHGQFVPVSENVVAVVGQAAPRVINTGSPATTNQKDLHNVAADYATVAQAHQARAAKIASRYAKN